MISLLKSCISEGLRRDEAQFDQYTAQKLADEFYFWATHQGAELDLLLIKNGRRVGVEVKFADAPKLTPSMRIALVDLNLERLWVIYPGALRYALAPRVVAVPAAVLADRGAMQIWRAEK